MDQSRWGRSGGPKKVILLPKLHAHFRHRVAEEGGSIQALVNETLCHAIGRPDWYEVVPDRDTGPIRTQAS